MEKKSISECIIKVVLEVLVKYIPEREHELVTSGS